MLLVEEEDDSAGIRYPEEENGENDFVSSRVATLWCVRL